MKRTVRKPTTIDEYIAAASPEAQPVLRTIRRTLRAAVPESTEHIGYQMPALRAPNVFVYFAAFKKHIGIFPPVTGSPTLQARLARYRGPKGNLQFPLDQPMPYALIAQVAKALLREQLARAAKRR